MADTARTVTIELGIEPERLALIDRAAEIRGQSRSDFIVDRAEAAAEETVDDDALVDRTLFLVPPDAFDALLAALDAPPAPNEALGRLLSKKPSWE